MHKSDCSKERRGFLKGLLATGAAGALGGVSGSLLLPARSEAKPFDPSAYQVFRNACPRNCYDTCSIKTYVKDGIVQFVEGAPESSFTQGALCVKGYSYPRRVYSPDRIKYPMIQEGRGSGNWRRISWDEAMDRISDKILELKKKDGNLLGLGLTKYSGNFGITNYGVEGMMSSLGYTSRFVGTPCWPAGIDAQNYDFGDMWCNDPEDMVKAKYIIVWGANPAWCSMHTMKYIYEARQKGAKVVVIDPIFTQTAAKGDVYWQVRAGGGARYGHLQTWGFNYHAMTQQRPAGSKGFVGGGGPKGEFDFGGGEKAAYTDRSLNINRIAQEILDAKDPELKMLWVSCKNPFAQDFDRNKLERAFKKLDMVVSVEQFFTETVRHSDIVLPVTTLFEEWTINVSYWHYWLSLNEQAIKPMHEARSNIEIAAALSRAMNRKEAGSCTFPQEVDGKEWMAKECNKGIYDLFGIPGWEALRQGPVKAKRKSSAAWPERTFKTPSGKYEFKSDLCAKNGFKALPEFVEGRKASGPFRLLTPHVQFGLHSQFINLDWMENFYPEPYVYIHPNAAQERGIRDMGMVKVFNGIGEVRLRARLSTNVAADCLVMYEAWFRKLDFNVQNLVDDCPSDMGAMKTGSPGVAIHDQFADVVAVNGGLA